MGFPSRRQGNTKCDDEHNYLLMQITTTPQAHPAHFRWFRRLRRWEKAAGMTAAVDWHTSAVGSPTSSPTGGRTSPSRWSARRMGWRRPGKQRPWDPPNAGLQERHYMRRFVDSAEPRSAEGARAGGAPPPRPYRRSRPAGLPALDRLHAEAVPPPPAPPCARRPAASPPESPRCPSRSAAQGPKAARCAPRRVAPAA